jgi:transglutaminase-like putative cysteine protease
MVTIYQIKMMNIAHDIIMPQKINFYLILLVLFFSCSTREKINKMDESEIIESSETINYELFEDLYGALNRTNFITRNQTFDLISEAKPAELNLFKDGNTLLHLTFDKINRPGYKEIAGKLVDNGADVDLKNTNGDSFLMLIIEKAKYQNYQPLVEKALLSSQNINQQNVEGKTCYDILDAQRQFLGIIELQELIKNRLHLRVDSVVTSNYSNGTISYLIHFSEPLSEQQNLDTIIRIIDMNKMTITSEVHSISGNILQIQIPDYEFSYRYFIKISKKLKSNINRNFVKDYFAELDHYSLFKSVDDYARSTPLIVESEIKSLSNHLTEPYKDTLKKIRSIYVWVTDRITYDVYGLSNYSYILSLPEMVLKTRTAVCQGYSELFCALCDSAGIPCKIISGYGKGSGYSVGQSIADETNHAWNVVKINSKWHFIDNTWGAGYVMLSAFVKKFTNTYFLTPPEIFITGHFPKESKWQLLSHTVDIKSFEQMINLDKSYEYGLLLISPVNAIIKDSHQIIELWVPDDIDLITQPETIKKIRKTNFKWEIEVPDIKDDNPSFKIFAKRSANQANQYTGILEYLIAAD